MLVSLYLSVATIFIVAALSTLQYLQNQLQATLETVPVKEKSIKNVLKQLGTYLHKLHQSSREFLVDATAELLSRARALGIEGLEGEPAFISGEKPQTGQITWDSSLAEKYDGIGAVEEGDLVFIEQKPVIHEGEIIEKGLVRKVRGN